MSVTSIEVGIALDIFAPGWQARGPGAADTGLTGRDGKTPMALPVDQVIRQRRFLAANPEWSIQSQDMGGRFTAQCDDQSRAVVAMSLRELLDRLEQIAGDPA
jgi:hypothetical protein